VTRRVAFSLGANLDDPLAHVLGAIETLSENPALANVEVSSLYRTAPVGGVEQPDYLNAVLVADTELTPDQLIDLAMSIEQEHGRTREVRWGARTLDVDVLALGDVVSDDPRILLPHPRAHERAFVLIPWSEVDPNAMLSGVRVGQLRDRLAVDELAGVHKVDQT
jgi:hypothetical protein